MNYKKGDVVIVKFPFILKEKGAIQKGRPALVMPDDKLEIRHRDVILAAITSHIPENINVGKDKQPNGETIPPLLN